MKIDADYQILAKVLRKTSDNYVVPLFQRRYSWEISHCEDLWNDFMGVVEDSDGNKSHFIGAVVFQEKGTQKWIHRSLIIDGQQRLTTLTLLIAAMRDRVLQIEPHSDLLPKMEELLACPNYKNVGNPVEGMMEVKEGYFRIHPSEIDKKNYYFIVARKDIQADKTSNIYKSYDYFSKKLQSYTAVEDVENLYNKLIHNIGLVVIVIDKDHSPYEVFATLNQRGLKLTVADLIRNHLFDQIHDEELQKKYYTKYFKPTEETFEQLRVELIAAKQRYKDLKYTGSVDNPQSDYLSDFMYRNWSAYKRGIVPKNRLVKEIADEIKGLDATHAFLERMKIHSQFYVSFILPKFESHPEVRMALEDIKRLGETTFYPLLLELFNLRYIGKINGDVLARMIRVIENVMVRVKLHEKKSDANFNREFPAIIEKLHSGTTVQDLVEAILTYTAYPTDDEIKQKARDTEFYGGGKNDYVRLLLIQLNRSYAHDEEIHYEIRYPDAEIEHIIPQKYEKWKDYFPKPEWQKLESFPSIVNWLGNLTLINSAYNKRISNEEFEAKRKEFDKSPYTITREVATYPDFFPSTIERRTEQMLERLVTHVYPDLKRSII